MAAKRTSHRVSVRRYRHSATSKFVVSWGTGSTPSTIERATWDQAHPNGTKEERARFMRGSWRRHRQFFRTRSLADTFALAKETELANGDTAALALPMSLRVMAHECAEKLRPYGYTLAQAVDGFIEQLKAKQRSATLEEFVPIYLTFKKQQGQKDRTLKDAEYRLRALVEVFGPRHLATITTAEIEDWLTSLGLGAQSRNNYRAVTSALFARAVKRGYADRNPVERIDKVKLADKPAKIFQPESLTRLLHAADGDTLPVLAIGAFAGLRMAEIFRLDWREVDQQRGFIEVTADKSKTARRRLVKILPNLADWLRPFADHKGPVWRGRAGRHGSEGNWRACLDKVRAAAELTDWPENGLRHSYGSYHLAKWHNAAALALEMGHTSTKEIFAHYRELVRPEDAERYWAIRPAGAAANVVPMEAVAT